MRTSVLPTALLAMCFVIAPAFCLAQQPPATAPASGDPNDRLATIAGTVVSANTGEPLKRAQVILTQQRAGGDGPDNKPVSVAADATGHFSVDNIPAGNYDLVVTHTDYLPSRYGQDQIDKPGATLSLAPGQRIADLIFRLHHMGIITGRIRNEDGDPVREVTVTALHRSTVRGKSKTEEAGSGITDDLGEYRIFDLPPGGYSIVATPGVWILFGPKLSTSDVPTYYPGTTDGSRASTIEVKSGDEISGIDHVLAPRVPIRTFSIRGRVLNLYESGVGIALKRNIPSGSEDLSLAVDDQQAQPDQKTGEFEITEVVPGEYVLTARAEVDGKVFQALQSVNVAASNVDGISLLLIKGIDLSGRLTFEGTPAASAPDIEISLVDNEVGFIPGGGYESPFNGTFVFKGVRDGSYSLRVTSKCQECYLKSAKANGVDLLEQGVQISSGAGPGPIAIVYSSNTGTLTGAVTNKDDLPAPGAMVVLIPDAGSHQKPEQYKTANTDQYGHFEVRGVPPGHYRAFAWEKLDGVAYDDLAFLKPLESKAESFDIAANEQKSVQLKMIPASDAAN